MVKFIAQTQTIEAVFWYQEWSEEISTTQHKLLNIYFLYKQNLIRVFLIFIMFSHFFYTIKPFFRFIFSNKTNMWLMITFQKDKYLYLNQWFVKQYNSHPRHSFRQNVLYIQYLEILLVIENIFIILCLVGGGFEVTTVVEGWRFSVNYLFISIKRT